MYFCLSVYHCGVGGFVNLELVKEYEEKMEEKEVQEEEDVDNKYRRRKGKKGGCSSCKHFEKKIKTV